MNTIGRIRIASAVAAAVALTAGFLSLQFLKPSPRFLAGRPEALNEGAPILRGPRDHPVFVVKKDGRVFSLDPSCPPIGPTPTAARSCRLEWKAAEKVFACPCDPSTTYDAEGRALTPASPWLNRHRTTLAPNGEVMVDRSVTFAEKDWLKPGADLFLVPPVQSGQGM